MLSVSESFPTHLVVLNVARNLPFDNRSPLGLCLGVTWRKETPWLTPRGDILHSVMPRDSQASLPSYGRASFLTSFGTASQGETPRLRFGMIKKMFGGKKSLGCKKEGSG